MAVYRAVCVSTLLYGCEAWVLYGRHIKTLEQFHISCLQRMLRLHWWDILPHVEIRQRAHCLSMEAIIAERQLRWTGNVIRMPENRLPRRVLYAGVLKRCIQWHTQKISERVLKCRHNRVTSQINFRGSAEGTTILWDPGACPQENFAKLLLKIRIFVHFESKFQYNAFTILSSR